MYRTKEYRITQRHKHIARKKRICNYRKTFTVVSDGRRNIADSSRLVPMEWYPHDGMYDKGKIHCSCKLCKYSRHFGLPTLRDIKEMQKFSYELTRI